MSTGLESVREDEEEAEEEEEEEEEGGEVGDGTKRSQGHGCRTCEGVWKNVN